MQLKAVRVVGFVSSGKGNVLKISIGLCNQPKNKYKYPNICNTQ
jgi:hypothetical protein